MRSHRRHSGLLVGRPVLPRWMIANQRRGRITGVIRRWPPPPPARRHKRSFYWIWWSWVVLGSIAVLLGSITFIAMSERSPARSLPGAENAASHPTGHLNEPPAATGDGDSQKDFTGSAPQTVAPTTVPLPTTTSRLTTTSRPTDKARASSVLHAPTTTTAVASIGMSSPSGQSMPMKAPAGYQQVIADDFTGSTLGSDWHPYSGQPGSDTGGWWDPSHVTVGNGLLTLRTYQDPAHAGPNRSTWVEGGIDLWPTGVLTNGEYLVRSRVTSAAGVTQVMILWPNSDQWPPEIDFNESNGTNESTAHLWYGTASDPQVLHSVTLTNVNLTQWHTWGVIVTPLTITYTLDGTTWATMPNQEQVPMHLAIQQQVWPCSNQSEVCPSASTPPEVDLQVDWVVVYAPAS